MYTNLFTADNLACDSPKTINYDSRNDVDVTILTINNKVNEEAVNSLKGSTKKWSPNDQGSGITYVVNGQNNTAQFVDGTFTTINVEYVTIDLLDTRGQNNDLLSFLSALVHWCKKN
jgi:hypothetical protein